MSKVKLSVGDLVRVTEDTHDPKLPHNRTGLLVEPVIEQAWNEHHAPVGVWNVLMTKGEKLRFHEMFLEIIENEKNKEKS